MFRNSYAFSKSGSRRKRDDKIMMNIAIIEDDNGLNNGIALALKNETYHFLQYASLEEAKKAKLDRDADLIILDINLPDGNGFDYLRELRKTSNVPVIILTANDLETDEVMGLELGADDYITKPFSLMVLRARIEKVLQREKAHKKDAYEIDGLLFDFEQMHFRKDGQEIELSKTEQKLLCMLVQTKVHSDSIWDRLCLAGRGIEPWVKDLVYISGNGGCELHTGD